MDALAQAVLDALGTSNSDSAPKARTLFDAVTVELGAGTEDARVTVLPPGATAKNPDGYDSIETLAAVMRKPSYMGRRSDRNSHRRWSPYPGVVGAILENKDRSWRGRAACRRQHAKARAASLWYGVPNIILGS